MDMMMDIEQNPPKPLITRHGCPACFKQFKRKEHLVEHMKNSYHSIHQPRCGVCQKHCISYESLREHLIGSRAKLNCSKIFSDQGCDICVEAFDNHESLEKHKETCCLSAPASLIPKHHDACLDGFTFDYIKESSLNNSWMIKVKHRDKGDTIKLITDSKFKIARLTDRNNSDKGPEVVALDCEMVGGGFDGSIDICASVCLIDEDENVIFHAYIQPPHPVTNYRFELTGLTEEHFNDALPLKEVQDKIQEILYYGESISWIRMGGARSKLLVGHNLEHDLNCLKIIFPDHMQRDTANYVPLMKTNLVSHSLKYLTKKYLGYDIQSGVHDPYEDCVSAMRLYKRMRAQHHQAEGTKTQKNIGTGFNSWKSEELVKMTPDELYKMSRSNFKCWCLDSKHTGEGPGV
ncbi:hypothetical protein ACFE04_031871 [Oxalis oulophora]